mgnify:CR=1 FL=1
MANLMLHAGAKPVTKEDLKRQANPVPMTKTHTPTRHDWFVDMILKSLEKQGDFEVVNEEYGLTQDGANMFAVLGIRGLNPQGDYETMLAARNSNRQDFAASLGFSTRVFVCDNLAFSVDDPISRKHTKFIWRDLREGIDAKVAQLADQGKEIVARYDQLKGWVCDDAEADHIMMESVRSGAAMVTDLPKIDAEWRKPRHKEFNDRTLWSLFNGFTQVNQDKKLAFEHVIPRTKSLHNVFDQHTGFKAEQVHNQPELIAA